MKKLLFALLLLPCLAFAQSTLNYQINVIPSQAITGTITSGTYSNENCTGIHLFLFVTSYTSGNITVHLQEGYNDPILGQQWIDMLVSPAISSTTGSPYRFILARGVTILANYSASDFLPVQWRVQVVGASSPSMTISMGANCDS